MVVSLAKLPLFSSLLNNVLLLMLLWTVSISATDGLNSSWCNLSSTRNSNRTRLTSSIDAVAMTEALEALEEVDMAISEVDAVVAVVVAAVVTAIVAANSELSTFLTTLLQKIGTRPLKCVDFHSQ